jgi:hypothetical protein
MPANSRSAPPVDSRFPGREMNVYVRTFLIAGIFIPIFLHVVSPRSMPWWPDTVSLGIAFGVAGVLIVSKYRTDREMKRRLWNALKDVVNRRGSK